MPAPADYLWRRVAAFVLDLLLLTLFGALLGYSLESMGTMSLAPPMSVVGAAFLLLRDVGGASPGKLIVGLRVRWPGIVRCSHWPQLDLGSRSALSSVVPAGGFSGDLVRSVGSLVHLVEFGFVRAEGRRIGDRGAGTVVMPRGL